MVRLLMVNQFEEEWTKSDWTQEAINLIEGLKDFSDKSNLIMFLRHSHREPILNVEEMTNLGLTELGKGVAKIFGKNLPKNRTIRLYHSAIARCHETAECILEGFQEVGGKGTLMGPLKPLFQVQGDPEYIVQQIFENPDGQLINRWAAGHFPPVKIQPLNIYSHKTAKKVFNIAKKAPNDNMVICVTHDLQIMALRFSWFGLQPCDYWVSYLRGFIISKGQIKTLFHNNGKLHKVKTPFWWTNL